MCDCCFILFQAFPLCYVNPICVVMGGQQPGKHLLLRSAAARNFSLRLTIWRQSSRRQRCRSNPDSSSGGESEERSRRFECQVHHSTRQGFPSYDTHFWCCNADINRETCKFTSRELNGSLFQCEMVAKWQTRIQVCFELPALFWLKTDPRTTTT